jgi:hypothetical protein
MTISATIAAFLTMTTLFGLVVLVPSHRSQIIIAQTDNSCPDGLPPDSHCITTNNSQQQQQTCPDGSQGSYGNCLTQHQLQHILDQSIELVICKSVLGVIVNHGIPALLPRGLGVIVNPPYYLPE